MWISISIYNAALSVAFTPFKCYLEKDPIDSEFENKILINDEAKYA